MREFENKTCDCCHEPFREEDEIVVCPDCGTPIHRSCWNGHCPNEARHAEGYDWEKDHGAASASDKKSAASPTEGEICAICGEVFNDGDEIVNCPECGTPMHRACHAKTGRCPNEPRHVYGYVYTPPGVGSGETFSYKNIEDYIAKVQERERERGEERTCFGVRRSELIRFLGVRNLSTPRFYSLFFHMADTGRKVSFNFLAGILMPFYQLYRKMTGPGIILCITMMIANIPGLIANVLVLTHGGESAALPEGLLSLAEGFSYAYLVVRLLVILFNDYLFMRWTVGRILSLRELYAGAPESEYMAALEEAGRPRLSFAVMGLLALSGVTYLLLAVILGSSLGAAA
ncbi:MAG: hypothetical protein NC084_10400 [Bacteroides sp.]|nr:hypothetical protein [Eubacterium sp.]MCM1418996.1 hypothetical protein [Roseburia sp.]MCM1463110.1 hypothetical protein [Bacteroides sp.]